jgi:alpha-amylase/alpha-mannosidase (GH57 family)
MNMYTQFMITNIVLHGHFYQPPREYPETGIIPYQKSAEPFSDWNERIYYECYRANAFSRYLTYDGRIQDIVNNYSRISYNFGPTLMKWLKSEAEETYEKIIEADKTSAEILNGHGNAIAQPYNHTILPLDSQRDAETQLVWGLQDFNYHFNRPAEGLWLPEAAINQKTIDLLIKHGVSFIILSPWQAEKLLFDDGNVIYSSAVQTKSLHNQPFRLEGKSGSVSAFFYNPDLASGISFGHFLKNADSLYKTIKEFSCQDGVCNSFVHTATDGEIYGHHEPYGDMCLAALIKKIDNDPSLRITNYGEFLEKKPPIATAVLNTGEDSKGSSWSCSHGVSRWYKDCGCSTGGEEKWNQKWRVPLRSAFNALNISLLDIFKKKISQITAMNPDQILLEYGKVICGLENPNDFVHKYVKENSSSHLKSRLLTLLEGQKFRHFMFTSCGWFFSDISGIEPRQNIKYALHAIKLFAEFTDIDLRKQLENLLEKAESNIPEMKNGKVQLISVLPIFSGIYESAAYFAMSYFLTAENHNQTSDYGFFHLLDFTENDEISSTEESNEIIKNFTVKIENTTILKQYSCNVVLIDNINDEIVIQVIVKSESLEPVTIPLHLLPQRMLNSITKWANESFKIKSGFDLKKISNILRIFTTSKETLSYSKNHFIQDKKPDSTLLGYCILYIRHEFSLVDYCQKSQFSHKSNLLIAILSIIGEFGSDQDLVTVKSLIQEFLKRQIDILIQTPNDTCALKLTEFLKILSKCGFSVDITQLQEIVFNLKSDDNFKLLQTEKGLQSLTQQLGICLD